MIQNKKILLSISTIFVSLFVLYLKYEAWNKTGSVAFYSDMLETNINVIAAILEYIALSVASLPADANYTYGHEKAEYISAATEGIFVLFTTAVIFYESWQGLQHPHMPSAPLIGILLNGLAGLVNLFWAILLIKTGKKYCSPTLIAGGEHILSDVWTTIGLICGFVLIPLTHWAILDSIIGFLIALNILRMGFNILKSSINGLMDKAPDPKTIENIYKIIHDNAPEAKNYHMVRFRKVGAMLFIDFHLVVSGDMTVYNAHKICDRIENALHQTIGQASINIHVEPEDHA